MKFAFRCLLFLCLLATHASFAQDILIAVKKDGKWGYVNTSGASVIDAKGAWLVPPRKGTALGEINSNRVVCSNELGKWGAIDTKGSTKVEFEKDIMSAFQTGWALAGSKTSSAGIYRVAVIDTLGK